MFELVPHFHTTFPFKIEITQGGESFLIISRYAMSSEMKTLEDVKKARGFENWENYSEIRNKLIRQEEAIIRMCEAYNESLKS